MIALVATIWQHRRYFLLTLPLTIAGYFLWRAMMKDVESVEGLEATTLSAIRAMPYVGGLAFGLAFTWVGHGVMDMISPCDICQPKRT
jgi:hypothetical protein